ncbi:ApbE family lipoprotein [[Clostridium] saccharolyticum WM1]|uniref:FAD:protein FMN transferase n=2 Tax=Lacrimispora TaxID=2719231 RepID=D9R605_LACSW|nr:FAD:protein FMN transferase [Lacrimispora saccharolytica]ADL03439.1 ApbE family lipoprotein [[Clostridium] saccharolyticum WM1]QRV18411.1 FAD:protein FMN transferase [Lacrimispora saccharolytica]
MKKGWGVVLMAGMAALLLAGCGRGVEPVTQSGFMLNTFVTVTIYDKNDPGILSECLDLCRSYENMFSKTIEGSEVYKLNHRMAGETAVTLSPDVADLLSRGLYYSQISEGAFDITVEPLSSLWNFTSEHPAVPPAEKIEEARKKVDYRNLKLEGNTVTFLSPDTSLDFGAIAKGYIADRMKDFLLEKGVKSAIINLGGNVLCVGQKPEGKPFKIGLQKPYADRNETIETLDIKDMSVVSSGVYERHFVKDGVNYHHILNPRDGYPYENGLVSVTILSKLSADGDALSTTCFSLGLEKGMKLLESIDGVYGVFITEAGEVLYSQGAREFLASEP